MWKLLRFLSILVALKGVGYVLSQFQECDADPAEEEGEEEGTLPHMEFTWIGTLQYIHIKNGTPHYFRVPRVILISRQFVLSTAVDAAQIPEGYALGNVAFGEYERDEVECNVTPEKLAKGAKCESATVLVPLSDVLLHPEYKHFGVVDSIALLKLITPLNSYYMLPACLPFKNFLIAKNGFQTRDHFFHIDFTSDVPRDVINEEKELTHLRLLPKEICYLYDAPNNDTTMTKERIMCTTGCGFRSGAPSVVHERTGHWSVVSVSRGGSPCLDPLRSRRPPPPPRHILLHPYVPWITAAISGKAVGSFNKDDPFGFGMPQENKIARQDPVAEIFKDCKTFNPYDCFGHEWVGHWWMGGLRCHDREEDASDLFRFYHEIFVIKPVGETFMHYELEIYAPPSTAIICVKVGMPFRLGRPKVIDLNTPDVRLKIPLFGFEHEYKLQIEAWGYNTTEDSGRDSDEECDSNVDSCIQHEFDYPGLEPGAYPLT